MSRVLNKLNSTLNKSLEGEKSASISHNKYKPWIIDLEVDKSERLKGHY